MTVWPLVAFLLTNEWQLFSSAKSNNRVPNDSCAREHKTKSACMSQSIRQIRHNSNLVKFTNFQMCTGCVTNAGAINILCAMYMFKGMETYP